MLYAQGFVALLSVGLLSGLFLAMLAPGVHLSAICFELARLHCLVVGGALMALLAGLHHWWPKMTGRPVSLCASPAGPILALQLCCAAP